MTRTITLTELVDAPPADDPFRYGSRYVLRTREDGTLYSETLPLTIWDVLHPQEGDHITQSLRHQKEVRYLASVIEARVARSERTLVLSDTPVYWDVPGLSHHAPDVAVICEVRDMKEQYTSFHVAQETVRPELIIEVVSPHVRSNDTETKLSEYHAARVPMFVIIDREKEDDWPSILGYRWQPGEYEALALDDRDCLLLPMLGLRLCVNQNRVTLYDAGSGEELGDYLAISQALEAEAQARQEAEDRARLAEEATRLAKEQTKEALEAAESIRLDLEQEKGKADSAYEAQRAAEKQARQADEARQKAEDEKRQSDDARQKAEDEKGQSEEARQKAEDEKRQIDEARQKAEDEKRQIDVARQKAEDRAVAEANARADLERRLRELEERLQGKQGD